MKSNEGQRRYCLRTGWSRSLPLKSGKKKRRSEEPRPDRLRLSPSFDGGEPVAKHLNPRAESGWRECLSLGFPQVFRFGFWPPESPWGGGNYKSATVLSKVFFMHSACLQSALGITQVFHRHTSDRRLHERGSAHHRTAGVHESRVRVCGDASAFRGLPLRTRGHPS